MNLIILLLLSCASGIMYRLGGASKKNDWLDWARNTKARDLGVSLTTTVAVNLWHPGLPWWASLIHFGLLFAALTTYWDFLNKEREVWWTWMITGFFYGLAAAPYAFSSVSWLDMFIRCVALAVMTMGWRMAWVIDVIEEFGVGFLITLSVIIL